MKSYALAISLVACPASPMAPTQTPAAPTHPSVALPPELARVLTDYETAWANRNADELANLFAEDGFVLQGHRQPVRGRAAIKESYKDSGGPLSLRAIAYATEGQIGYIIGCYAPSEGQPDDGKFTLTLRRGPNNRWLIMSDMDNSSRPRG